MYTCIKANIALEIFFNNAGEKGKKKSGEIGEIILKERYTLLPYLLKAARGTLDPGRERELGRLIV